MSEKLEGAPRPQARRRPFSRPALRVTLLYVVLAALWIVGSDAVLGMMVREPALLTILSIAKGWLFVLATGLLLYALVSRAVRPIADSAEEYRGLFEGHPSIYLKVDESGTVLSVNPPGAEQLGYAVGELTGRSVLHLYADSDRRTVMEKIETLSRGVAEVARWEAQACRKDGSRVFVRQSARALPGARGGRAILMVGEDITERHRSEAALGAAHDNLRAVFQASPLAIVAVDRGGRVLSWNPAAAAIFGWVEEEVLGRPAPFVPDQLREEFATLFRRVLEGEAIAELELLRHRKDGTAVAVSLSAAPLRDAAGATIGAMAVIADITRRKAAERELVRLNRALRVLTECNQAVMRAGTEGELLGSVCRIVVEAGGYRLAWIGYAEHDDSRSVRPVAHSGFEEGYLDRVRITWADDEHGRGPTGAAIRSGKPSIARDLETDPSYGPWRAEAGRRGFASSIGLPLGLSGMPFGAISIYAAEPDAFDAEEVGLLLELAADVSYGIEALRAREERRRAEERLRESTSELEAIFKAFPDLYFRLDASDRIVTYHAGRAADLYVPPERFLGRRMQDVLPNDVARGFDDAIREARTTGGAGMEYSLPLPAGEKWFEARLVKMVGEQVLAIVRDITAQEALRDELRRRAAELERRVEERTAELTAANEELESFSYSVTHDLRAPLRAMEGFARALIEDHAGGLDEEGRRYAGRIAAAALRLDLVIQDLLRYSRLRMAEIRLKPVSLDAVVAEVVAARETAIETAGATVDVDAPLPEVNAHRPTLVQIVENLLDNALKFVARGVAARVRIRADASSATVRLWVEDNGIGVAPDDRERIFKVFERLHGVETYPGSGIGLAIVRKAAERMGGRAGVEPAEGSGSRFWVELAAARPQGGRTMLEDRTGEA